MSKHRAKLSEIAFENSQAVQVTEFDPSSLDSPEDIMREMLESGKTVEQIMSVIGLDVIEAEVAKKIAIIFAIVQTHKRPMLFIDQICWHTGAALANGMSLLRLAEKYGQTKQAFEQSSARAVAKLRLRKTRTQRSAAAKQNMRSAYCKPDAPSLKIPFLDQ